jgi:glyoxylase-like metal-dependent hydrolase (beta-lactamase superfamily II)
LISEPTSLVVGDTEFVLIPVRGGETPDALMVHMPATELLFTGDVMMPYLGVPFTAEGSPEGLLETLRYIRDLAPRQLIRARPGRVAEPAIEDRRLAVGELSLGGGDARSSPERARPRVPQSAPRL